jgi:hypothetical protein
MKFGNEFWLILIQVYIIPKLFAVCITLIARMAAETNCVVSDKYAIKLQAMENIMSQTYITFIARLATDKNWVVRDNMPLNCRLWRTSCPRPTSPS